MSAASSSSSAISSTKTPSIIYSEASSSNSDSPARVPRLRLGTLTSDSLNAVWNNISQRMNSPFNHSPVNSDRNRISRSRSDQPFTGNSSGRDALSYLPTYEHLSGRKKEVGFCPHSISNPSLRASEQLSERTLKKKIFRTECRLRRFFRLTEKRLLTDGGLARKSKSKYLVLSTTSKHPYWARRKTVAEINGKIIYEHLNDAEVVRVKEAIERVMKLINFMNDQGSDSFTIKPFDENGKVIKDSFFTHTELLNRILQNNNVLNVVNKNKDLRDKVVDCYLRSLAEKLHEDCGEIWAALYHMDKWELFEGVGTLRTKAKTMYLEANHHRPIENPIEFYGYSKIFFPLGVEKRAEKEAYISLNSSTELTYNGAEIVSTRNSLRQCWEIARHVVEAVDREKGRNYHRIGRPEKLCGGKSQGLFERFCEPIGLGTVGNMTAVFEQSLKGFVESTLTFLFAQYNSEMIRLEVDLRGLDEKMRCCIKKPYNRHQIIMFLNELNFIVGKVLKKYDQGRELLSPIIVRDTPRNNKPILPE